MSEKINSFIHPSDYHVYCDVTLSLYALKEIYNQLKEKAQVDKDNSNSSAETNNIVIQVELLLNGQCSQLQREIEKIHKKILAYQDKINHHRDALKNDSLSKKDRSIHTDQITYSEEMLKVLRDKESDYLNSFNGLIISTENNNHLKTTEASIILNPLIDKGYPYPIMKNIKPQKITDSEEDK